MIPKVLVWVDDGRITVLHSRGVETAVVVAGEDIDFPDDWVGLICKHEHSLPITVNRAELPQKRPLQCPETQLAAPNTQVHHATAEKYVEDGQPAPTTPELEHEIASLMKAPYCYACDGNHPDGECPRPGDVFDDLGSS